MLYRSRNGHLAYVLRPDLSISFYHGLNSQSKGEALISQRFMAMVKVSKLLVIVKKGRIKHVIGQAYERFLELPVPLVLAALWFAGLAILGFLGLVLYLYGALLAQVLTGG
jgi:hypothetical protein